MIQATCTCGWTMAGPPADSWEIDQAIDEHDIWCPDNQDWVSAEMDGQEFERDRIIGRIRQTFSAEHSDFIVDVITRNTKSDPVIRQDTGAAQDQTTTKGYKPMINSTSNPTSSAWCPVWCNTQHGADPDWVDTDDFRIHTHIIGEPSRATVALIQEDHPEDTGPVMVGVYDLDRDLNLAELDELIGVLATARQRLVETGEG